MINFIIDLLFPPKCIGCGEFLDENKYLCRSCLNTIPTNGIYECIGCRRPTPNGATCPFCRPDNSIDQLIVVSDFKNPILNKAIKFFKYRFIKDLDKDLFLLAKRCLVGASKRKGMNLFENNPVVVSVPLTNKRLNWRGFNQAEILGSMISRMFLSEFNPDCLIRTKHSIPQADIDDRELRLSNLLRNFKCTDGSIKDRNILLIDDVCTTGATLNECAKELKSKGALKVTGLVIARG